MYRITKIPDGIINYPFTIRLIINLAAMGSCAACSLQRYDQNSSISRDLLEDGLRGKGLEK
jgi:hypothetical protein